ncbi:MAG TPA: sigma-70 family RNA polymerase sigma factor [Bryobacterales bacterium]|nr:sigma-70 family RNA polymerase sigma factor [Bryobacterales bacterium]
MAKLYDMFGRVVYALIYRIVQDSGVAEDLVQETFLRVWNQAHAIDPSRGSPAAWLLTVARNRAIDWRRSKAGKPERSVWESYDDERPGNFLDMEKTLIDSDRVNRVRRAMEKLNENQRFVIEMAYFEGLSQSEMAERMGQPLGTVKTWVRAALKNLREELLPAAGAL